MTNRSFVCKGGASDSEEIQVVLRRRAPLVIGAVTVLCLSAVACTPSGPTPPTPTPTPYASPTETKLERQTRLDFEAAEKAYRTFSAEFDRLANAGGVKQPTQVMEQTAAGPYLKQAAASLRQQSAGGGRSTGRVVIAWVRSGGYEPARLTMDSCEDASGVKNYSKSGKLLSKGKIGTIAVEARRIDGRWKVWNATNAVAVTSCAQ